MVLTSVAPIPAMVVPPSEDMMQFLSKGFVAHLHHPTGVSRIQT